MREETTAGLPFKRIDQIGVIVKNMDEAIKYYESLGIGPFVPSKSIISERKVLGKPIDPETLKLKVYTARMGLVDFELIEPVKGEFLWREFLEMKGEGINHLGFFVDDIEKEEANLVKKGFKLLYCSRRQNGGGASYFATDKVGGILFEIIQRS